jgi:molybdenum cofactor cytidylyltransferase
VISAVILAAGEARRFGRTKQLVELDGRPLVQHAVDAARAAAIDDLVVVLGHDAERVRRAMHLPANARAVENRDYAAGQATSLAAGLCAADPRSEAAIILLADQPGVAPSDLEALLLAFRERRRRIVRLRYHGGPGPALLAREVWSIACRLSGDAGARSLIAEHPEWVEEVAIDAEAPPDVDTPEDAARLGIDVAR